MSCFRGICRYHYVGHLHVEYNFMSTKIDNSFSTIILMKLLGHMPLNTILYKFHFYIQVWILMFALATSKKNHYIYSPTPLEGQGSSAIYKGTGYQYPSMVQFFVCLQCSQLHCHRQQTLLDRIVLHHSWYSKCLAASMYSWWILSSFKYCCRLLP